MQEYPKMLYKLDGPVEIDGEFYSTCIVSSKEQEDEMISKEWKLTPSNSTIATEEPKKKGRKKKVEE